MSLMARNFLSVAVAVFVWVPAALAQSSDAGCTLDRVAWTFRQILRCQDGLTIVAETGAQFTLADRDRDGNVDSATLRLKALLIEGPAGKAKVRFQVITPQAIAAVRGTKWAVDVEQSKSSVFVVTGRVAVRRPDANTGVTPRAGRRCRRGRRIRSSDCAPLACRTRFRIDGPSRSVKADERPSAPDADRARSGRPLGIGPRRQTLARRRGVSRAG